MAGEDLADALPQTRVEIEHALDMGGGVLVVGIEARQEWMKVPTLLVGQLAHRRGDNHVGGAVPIGIRIVTGVIAWTLGLVLMPFLGHRHTGNHHMLNAIVRNRLEQLGHAGGFLEEIDVMQVCIAVGIFASHGAAAGNDQ